MCGRYLITLVAGRDEAAVPLPGAAEFPGALQRGADPAGADRAPVRGQAPVRAGALGADPGLGQGPEGVLAPDQCARRIGQRQARLPQRHEAAALPVPGRRLLRVEGGRAARSGPTWCGPRAGGPIAFAGLWECWMGPNGEEMETAAIITTDANRTLARHPSPHAGRGDRPTPSISGSIPTSTRSPRPRCSRPPREDFFEAYEISTAVNRVANDGPELILPRAELPAAPAEPLADASAKRGKKPKTDERQTSLF